MENIDKNIKFSSNDLTGNDNFETLLIKMGDDTIVFRWIKRNIGTPYCPTYAEHQYCDGNIFFQNMGNHKLIFCIRCGLRKKIPLSIITIRDFQKFCEENNNEQEVSRAELLDMDLV